MVRQYTAPVRVEGEGERTQYLISRPLPSPPPSSLLSLPSPPSSPWEYAAPVSRANSGSRLV